MCGIADDILIVGYDEDSRDHDGTLFIVLKMCRKGNLKLKKDKYYTRCTTDPSLEKVSRQGLQPDACKLYMLTVMQKPKSK